MIYAPYQYFVLGRYYLSIPSWNKFLFHGLEISGIVIVGEKQFYFDHAYVYYLAQAVSRWVNTQH